MALFKRAQRETPDTVAGCMALGDAYLKFKDYEKAEHFYAIVVKRMSCYLPGINNLGVVKIKLGKKEEAFKLFRYGMKLDPTYENFYLNLANLYSDEKRFSDAIETLDQCQAINGTSSKAKRFMKVIERKADDAKSGK